MSKNISNSLGITLDQWESARRACTVQAAMIQ